MKPTLNHYIIRLLMKGRVGRNIRMMLVTLMLVLSGIATNGNLFAQSTLGFSSVGLIGMPDTVGNNEQWLVGAQVKNYSFIDSLMNDTVQILGYVDTIPGPSSVTPFALPPVSGISLTPGSDTFFIIPFIFDIDTTIGSPGFHIGNNVIVVWPITTNSNFGVYDSVTVSVVIVASVNQGPQQAPSEIRCFPVPVNGPLFVTSSSRALVVKDIIIRDASGKIVAVSSNPSHGIDTEAWAAGIYLLDVTFENGRKGVYKIIK